MRSKLHSILPRSISTLVNQTHLHHCNSPLESTAVIATANAIKGGESRRRRGYHTVSKQQEGKKESLYAKISPKGGIGVSVRPDLDGWVKQGKRVRVAELLRIIHDLRKRKRFSQALELSEWMNEKGICKFSPTEHAVHLDLIGRVRGFESAETYFDSLPNPDKTEKTYGALLNCYVRQRQTDKSLTHLHKMKQLGFASSALTYNNIMCLYTNNGQYEKVPEVLEEMKRNGVSPDNYSYRICINSYGVRSDLQGIEKILKEMETEPHLVVDWNTYAVVANFYIKASLNDKAVDALKKAEVKIDASDGTGYNHLISLYAKLGKKYEILRLWELEKNACKRCINKDYINMLESLVKIGELEDAKKVLEEWESSDNCYDFRIPNIIIMGYIEKGFLEKAEKVLEELENKGNSPTPNSWGTVAVGYADKSEMRKAMKCMKRALAVNEKYEGWKPNIRVVSTLLSWVGDECSFEEADKFVRSLRTVIPVNRQMYHALIQASIRNGKDVSGILDEMKADKLKEDKETRELLSMIRT